MIITLITAVAKLRNIWCDWKSLDLLYTIGSHLNNFQSYVLRQRAAVDKYTTKLIYSTL